MNRIQRRRILAAVVAALSIFTCLVLVGCGPKPAAPIMPLAPPPPMNMIQKHPTATGIVAGVATHQMLKASAERKKEKGEKLNFAEKHPTLTGIAVGVATRHIIKKTTPHQ